MVRGDDNAVQLALINALNALTANMAQMQNNMANMNDHLVNQNNHAHHQPVNAACQIAKSKVKPYAGEVDAKILEQWMMDMEKQFLLYEVPAGDKVRIAAHMLTQDAELWWRTVGPTVQGAPGFGWDRFKMMLEERFYPEDNKRQMQDEFRECKQGKSSVQEYHDNFHRLVRFAGDVVGTEVQRVYYYKTGFSARIRSMIRPEANSIPTIYNEALRAERSLAAIRLEEDAATPSSFKRPFVQNQAHSSKRLKTENQVVPPNTTQVRSSSCFKCHKPYHPGKNCDGTSKGCFICKEVGHLAAACPKKAATTTVVPAKPLGRVFMMSRADAEANPDVITGRFPVSGVRAFILFDTGASLSVVSTTFADKVSLIPQVAESTPLSLPSGEIVSCSTIYSDVPIVFAGTVFPSTLLRFPLFEFDVVLGMDWLAKYDARFLCRD